MKLGVELVNIPPKYIPVVTRRFLIQIREHRFAEITEKRGRASAKMDYADSAEGWQGLHLEAGAFPSDF